MLPKAQESEVNWEKLETAVMKSREIMTSKLSGHKSASKKR
jgi:hypothetical protein